MILISTYAERDFVDLIAASPAIGFLAKSELSARAIHALLESRRDPDASRLEERDDRQHAAVIVPGLREAKLGEDAVNVLLHRSLCDPEEAGDAGVGPSLRHERKHLPLPRAQVRERVLDPARGDELLDESRIHDRGAADDPLQRLEELVHIRDPALEQIADSLTAGQKLHRVLHLDVGREDEDARLGKRLADRPRRLETLSRMSRRHSDVDEHQVGPVLADQVEQLHPVAGLPYHLELGALEQAGDALSKQDVVVRQDHSHSLINLLWRFSRPDSEARGSERTLALPRRFRVTRSLTDLSGLNVNTADFLAAMLEAAGQPIWAVDREGLIRFANPAALAALGYDSADELFGRRSHETIHYQHPDGTPYLAAECPMLLPRTTGEVVKSDLDWFFRRDGSMFPVSYVSVPLEMPDGRGAVVAFTAIEDRRRAEQVLREHDSVLAAREGSLRRIATLVAGGAASGEVLAAIASEVGQVLGMALVVIWRYNPDGPASVLGAWSDRPHPFQTGTRWPVEESTAAALLPEIGRPTRIEDFGEIGGAIPDAIRGTGIRSGTAPRSSSTANSGA